MKGGVRPNRITWGTCRWSMIREAVGFVLCLVPWLARAYVASKYQIRYRTAGEVRWAWKRGTPDWITKAMPWLEFLSWAALAGFVAWWLLRPVPVMAAMGLAMRLSPDTALECPSFR